MGIISQTEIGCDSVKHSDFSRAPLTKIDQSSEEIGERAAKLALGPLESETSPEPQTILLEPKLLPRDSTGR
jgi:LacI family transcriptional regulator